MFEFLRNLIPGRSGKEAPPPAKAAASGSKQQPVKGSGSVKKPGVAAATDRTTFGQKPKAVFKPAHQAKRRKKP